MRPSSFVHINSDQSFDKLSYIRWDVLQASVMTLRFTMGMEASNGDQYSDVGSGDGYLYKVIGLIKLARETVSIYL